MPWQEDMSQKVLASNPFACKGISLQSIQLVHLYNNIVAEFKQITINQSPTTFLSQMALVVTIRQVKL